MRETDEVKPPEAVAREAKEIRSTVLGSVVAGGGVVVVVAPAILGGELTLIPALAGLALVGLGGVLMDPKTFRPIIERALDVLPWGKKS